MSFSFIKTSVGHFLESLTEVQFIFFVTSLCTLLTLFFYFPDIDLYQKNKDFYQQVNTQIDFPLDPATYHSQGGIKQNNHFNKRMFRLTIPLIAKVLGLRAQHVYGCQLLCLPLFFMLLLRIFKKMTADVQSTFWLTLSFCFFYPAKSFAFHIPLYDCFAYLLLLALVLTSRTIITACLLFLLAFCDERALLASVVYLLCRLVTDTNTSANKNSVVKYKELCILFAVLAGYAFTRYYLSQHYHLHMVISNQNGVGLGILAKNFTYLPFTLFQSLEGWWIVLILFFLTALQHRKRPVFFLLGGSLVLIFLAAFCVTDLTRSAAYVFVLVFPALQFLLNQPLETSDKQKYAFLICVSCFCIPTYLVWGGDSGEVFWLSPALPKIFKFLL